MADLENRAIRMRPIGVVRNEIAAPIHEGWDEIISRLEIAPKWTAALDGIEDFSHLEVLFWIHGVPAARRRLLHIRPRDRLDLPLTGVFATRTQYRPNPIGVTIARLIERRGALLLVRGLDAIDGSPVLDVKPYRPRQDLGAIRVPDWMAKV